MAVSTRTSILLLVVIAMAASSFSQQTPATPVAILQAAISSLGAAQVHAISISGSAEGIAGSTDESGSFSAQCSTAGASRIQLTLGSLSRTETREVTNSIPSGNWVDDAGSQHSIVGHNLLSPASWFCPAIVISRVLQSSTIVVNLVDTESKNGIPVIHLTVDAPAVGTDNVSNLFAHLAHFDIFLNASNYQPVSFEFPTHPDNDARLDIPTEIRFSSYAQTSGVWLPTKIERYINNSLVLDLSAHQIEIQ